MTATTSAAATTTDPSGDCASHPDSAEPAPQPAHTRFPGFRRSLALVAADATALAVAGIAACSVSNGQPPWHFDRTCGDMLAVVPLFTLAYAGVGLYPGFDVGAIQLLRTASRQTSLVFLILAGAALVLPRAADYSAATVAIWWAGSLVAVPLVRKLVSTLARTRAWWCEPVLLIGRPAALRPLVESLGRAQHLGYRPVLAALTQALPGHREPAWLGMPLVAPGEAGAAAAHAGVRTVLLSSDEPAFERWAADLREHFQRVILVHSLENRFVEPSAIRYLGSAVGIEFQNRLLLRRHRLLKRVLDIVLATSALVLLLPFLAAAAVAVRLRSRGPWLHAQMRCGRGGRLFPMWKLRTMHPDADARLARHLAEDADARLEWEQEFKLRRDPRILPIVGGFLRRWSLDECPQFWNVIRGEMSLVGPRALPAYHLDAFGPEFRTLRQRVRPGMTGMWQVMSRGEGAIRAQEAFDRYYISNWSIWLDLFLLARTTMAVAKGRGAR